MTIQEVTPDTAVKGDIIIYRDYPNGIGAMTFERIYTTDTDKKLLLGRHTPAGLEISIQWKRLIGILHIT